MKKLILLFFVSIIADNLIAQPVSLPNAANRQLKAQNIDTTKGIHYQKPKTPPPPPVPTVAYADMIGTWNLTYFNISANGDTVYSQQGSIRLNADGSLYFRAQSLVGTFQTGTPPNNGSFSYSGNHLSLNFKPGSNSTTHQLAGDMTSKIVCVGIARITGASNRGFRMYKSPQNGPYLQSK